MYYKLIIFLIINFLALAIGGMFTSKAVTADWYLSLYKAPWTPPGWVFGAAWTTIMICFSIFMAFAWTEVENRNMLLALFALQWILNVAWNPIFFKFHAVLPGLIIIVVLTLLIGYFIFQYVAELKLNTLLLLPYFIWLLIATSLNGYILLKN